MKLFSRIFALVLAAALLCGTLAGCGGSDGSTTPTDSGSETVWVAKYLDAGSSKGSVNSLCSTDEYVYYILSSYTEDGASTSTIMRMKLDGTGAEALPDYALTAVAEGADGSAYASQICVGADGSLWVSEYMYQDVYNLPEGFDGTDEEREQYHESTNATYLRKLDSSGAELLSVDLSALTEENDYFYIQNVACDSDGNVYISGGDSGVCVFDANGKYLSQTSGIDWVESLVRLSDGRVAVSYYGETGQSVDVLDAKTGALGDTVISEYTDRLYEGSGDYLLFYTADDSFYGVRADTGEIEKLFTWLGCDLDSNSITGVRMLADGSFFCAASEDGDAPVFLALTKTPASEVTQLKTLTFATMSLSSGMRAQILKFNRTNSEYRIEVRDYSEYNTENDYNAGMTKLNTEMIAGNVPDIIDVSSLPVEQYAAKGLLEDLYPYLDADTELSRDSIVASALAQLETDGHLYRVSSGFGVLTLIGASEKVGSEPGWTFDEMLDCLSQQPEGMSLLGPYVTKTVMLQYLCYMYLNSFVDWGTATVSFNGGQFAKLLEFCNTFPAEYNGDYSESEYSLIQDGEQLMTLGSIYSFDSLQQYTAYFGDSAVYKGFPTEEGVGNIAMFDDGVAISATSQYKDAAWQFVRTLLTESYQTENVWSIPTNKAAMEASLASAMKKTYDEDGNEISTGGMGWDDVMIELYALTEEQGQQARDAIDSVSGTVSMDTNISDIVTSEAAAYFTGDKTLEQVVDIIQNRVSTYVSEQS